MVSQRAAVCTPASLPWRSRPCFSLACSNGLAAMHRRRHHRQPPIPPRPSVPAGVTATAQTPTQILVSWTASTDAGTGVAGYRVFRDGSNAALATVTTTTYTDNAVRGQHALQLHGARLRRGHSAE